MSPICQTNTQRRALLFIEEILYFLDYYTVEQNWAASAGIKLIGPPRWNILKSVA